MALDDGVEMSVQGLKELEDALLELEVKTASTALRRAGRAAMKPVLEQMKENAPEDTGELKDDLKMRTSLGKGKKAKSALVVKVGNSKKTGHYVLANEFGTSKREATPFMRDALEDNINEVLGIFIDELTDQIEKVSE